MAINPIHNSNTNISFTKIQASKNSESKAHAAGHSPHTKFKTETKTQNLTSAVNISAGDNPLQLIYQAMITKLNDELAPYLGSNSIQKGAKEGLDVSPAATADKIVSLATDFYDAFKAQHQNEDDQQVLDKFMDTIGSGIERGFAEAREILDQLGALQGSIATNVDQTFALMKIGLNNFYQVQQDLLP